MGELFDTCQKRYEKLRSHVESHASVDLSHLRMMEVKEYMDILFDAGLLPIEQEIELAMMTARYVEVDLTEEDFSAIVLNEFQLGHSDMPPPYVMVHELSHALHSVIDRPFWDDVCLNTKNLAIAEGFAVFYQTECLPLDEKLAQFTGEMKTDILTSYETGEITGLANAFSGPWSKVNGYCFFKQVTDEIGSHEYAFEILKNPPRNMDEILNPGQYLERVARNE